MAMAPVEPQGGKSVVRNQEVVREVKQGVLPSSPVPYALHNGLAAHPAKAARYPRGWSCSERSEISAGASDDISLEQFAKAHGITVGHAKQMTDTCSQIMSTARPVQPDAQ